MNDMKYYAEEEDGSGVEYDTIEEFFNYLRCKILDAQERGQEYFTVTIEKEPGKDE